MSVAEIWREQESSRDRKSESERGTLIARAESKVSVEGKNRRGGGEGERESRLFCGVEGRRVEKIEWKSERNRLLAHSGERQRESDKV